jgi:tetratricopeptide (TPR) repeat protein
VVVGVDTGNADAYDIYLQALQQRATFSYGGLETAEKLLKGALTIDPDFLDAKTELASNYLHQYETGLMSKDDAFAEVLAITDQVLTVRPQDVSARAIQIFVYALPGTMDGGSEDVFAAIQQLEDLVAENPRKYQARLLLSRLLEETQNSERALQLQLEALKLDPFNARIHYEVGSLYMHLDQIDEARASLQTSLDLEPLQPNAYLRLGEVALKSGDGVEYLQQGLKAMEVDSRDHEIPGMIAAFLYQLGLIEEADDFRNRVNAIAPTSAVAYRIELVRAISSGDVDAGVVAARKAIEDDIENRQFAYGGAVQFLLRNAARNGTVEAVSSYLEENAPGILDIDAAVVPARYFTAQRVAFDAWYTTLTTDELLRRVARIQEIAASYGVDLLQDPEARVSVMVMQSDTKDAVDLALSDVFSEPVLMNPDWRSRFSQAQFAEFVADPRIQAAMQSWEIEEEAARDRVRSYLLDLSSAS